MAFNPDNFLDLWTLFRSELVGDLILFVIISFMVIVFFATRGNVQWQVTSMFLVLAVMIFYSQVGSAVGILYLFVGIIAAFVFFYSLIKTLARGG